MISLIVRHVCFMFQVFCFILFQHSMCVYVSECLCVSVAVNSHACYIWIVNNITDCNSCLFSVSVCVFLFWSCVCKVVCVCLCGYMIKFKKRLE